jgi:hypothetical protein
MIVMSFFWSCLFFSCEPIKIAQYFFLIISSSTIVFLLLLLLVRLEDAEWCTKSMESTSLTRPLALCIAKLNSIVPGGPVTRTGMKQVAVPDWSIQLHEGRFTVLFLMMKCDYAWV